MIGLVEATVAAFEATIRLDDSREMERSMAEHSWKRELHALGSINRPSKKSISYKLRNEREVAAHLPAILLHADKQHG